MVLEKEEDAYAGVEEKGAECGSGAVRNLETGLDGESRGGTQIENK